MEKVPLDVKRDAQIGLEMMKVYNGGTPTGWNRARQLATKPYVDVKTLATMRAWYARHGPDAKSGGTSYPGYLKWLKDGRPMDGPKNNYRGAVAWMIWGGDAAYKWLKTLSVRRLLKEHYPDRKEASYKNNLRS